MDCTLAVEDAAYNSGRRSRSTSFHSQARDGTADGPDAAKELSPHVKDNFNSNLFLSHRRHASDLSDISALYPNGSEHAVDLADHSQLDLPSHTASPSFAEVFSPSLTTNIDTCDDTGLDEAFTTSLLMSEGYSRPMNLGQHLDQSSIYQAAPQPFSNTNRGSQSAVRPGSNNLSTSSRSGLLDPNVNSHMNPTMSSSMHGGNYAPLYDDEALLQAGLAHMGGAYVDYRSQSFGNSQPNVPDRIDFGYDQSTMHFSPINTASMLEHRASLQSPQSAMLNVPGLEGMAHNSLEVPSPYSDGASYDGSSFEDPHSPVVDPLTLSRTNSYNSQFQPPFETHLVSAPTSPFPPHLDYSNVQQFSPLADYESSFNGFPISAAPQYGFLQPPTAAQSHTSQDYGQRASLSIPGAMQSTSFDAPNISINPPSPNNNSFNGRSDLAHYPFPQQVPIITTTNVPTSANESQVNDSQSMLQVEKYRGRSNSDSRLMVQPHTPRSRSHSSQDSSSSSRAPSRSGTPGIHHKPGTSKISKSFDHHRRASWSGARDHIEEDYSSSLSPNKQKSPATFICPIEGCHKAFTRAYNLRSHQRTHTNERPFLCESCGKGFARQHDRKRHEKLHTNEKPFSCPGCKKKFARMDALSRHFKSETGKDCIIGNPEYEHFLLEDGEGGVGGGAGEED